jgi:hypothetical protein
MRLICKIILIYPRFNPLIKQFYQKKITLRDIFEKISTRTKKQIRAKIHKLKYKNEKQFGIFSSQKKQQNVSELIQDYKNCNLQMKDDQEYVQYHDENKSKSILIQKSLLENLIKCTPTSGGSAINIKLDENILKTVAMKRIMENVYYKRIEQEQK